MRLLITILFFSSVANAQIKPADVILSGLRVIAGASHGIREQVLYHPNELFKQHPNLNRRWWDSRTSWQNKNEMSPLLVSFSDANHFFKAAEFYSHMISISISTGDLKLKTIIKKILIAWVSWKAGFHATYTFHFKNK